jgi:hypothetical protein
MSKQNCSICEGSVHELRVEALLSFGISEESMTCIDCAEKSTTKRKGLVLGSDSSDFRLATSITEGAKLFEDRESEAEKGGDND